MRVIGIDPGSNATGYGVLEGPASRPVHVAHGVLRPPKGASLAMRLATLHAALGDVITLHRPEIAVVERVFVAVSARSALVLGQARGALLASIAGAGLSVSEFTPSEIKQAVTGSGASSKKQVQSMLRRLLVLERAPASDAADALAAALCYLNAGPLASASAPRRRSRSRASWPSLPPGRGVSR